MVARLVRRWERWAMSVQEAVKPATEYVLRAVLASKCRDSAAEE